MVAGRRASLGSLVALLLALMLSPPAGAQRLTTFQPGEIIEPGAFPTGGAVYVPRVSGKQPHLSIFRVGKDGSRRLVTRRPPQRGDDSGDPFPTFFGSATVVAARIDEISYGEGYPWVLGSELLAGTTRSSMRRIDPCPAGPVSVRESLLAELSLCRRDRHFRVRVFKVMHGSLKLVKAIRLPRSVIKPERDSHPPAELDGQISVNGNLVLVESGGRSTLIDWRRERTLHRFRWIDGAILFSNIDRAGNAVFGTDAPDLRLLRATRRSAARQVFEWPANASPKRVIDGRLVFMPDGNYLPNRGLLAMNLTDGTTTSYGAPQTDGINAQQLGRGGVDRDQVAWSEQGCYFAGVFSEPRNTPSPPNHYVCPTNYEEGSLQVDGKVIIARMDVPDGVYKVKVLVYDVTGSKVLAFTELSLPPGTGATTVTMPLSDSELAEIDKYKGGLVKLASLSDFYGPKDPQEWITTLGP